MGAKYIIATFVSMLGPPFSRKAMNATHCNLSVAIFRPYRWRVPLFIVSLSSLSCLFAKVNNINPTPSPQTKFTTHKKNYPFKFIYILLM